MHDDNDTQARVRFACVLHARTLGHSPRQLRRSRTISTAAVVERFWSRVKRGAPGECWLWERSVDGFGYGRFYFAGGNARAHRFSWVLHYGEIPVGLSVLHQCDRPRCVNPAHLFLGTHEENMADMVSKRRRPHGAAHAKTTLSESDVARIRRDSRPSRRVAAEYGVDPRTICRIRRRETWKYFEQNSDSA